jgi:hypothetical protein
MRFTDRSPVERTAILAWIRVTTMARENECLDVPDDYRQTQQKEISETPGDIGKMLRHYSAYRESRQTVSYTEYFQVSHPEEYAAILRREKGRP